MAFQLLNPPNESGDYLFKGRPIVFHKCYQYFSKTDITVIKEQIWKYTRTQSRGYVLIFENEHKERVYAYDNLSQTLINDMRLNGIAEFHIQEENFYILFPECDRL